MVSSAAWVIEAFFAYVFVREGLLFFLRPEKPYVKIYSPWHVLSSYLREIAFFAFALLVLVAMFFVWHGSSEIFILWLRLLVILICLSPWLEANVQARSWLTFSTSVYILLLAFPFSWKHYLYLLLLFPDTLFIKRLMWKGMNKGKTSLLLAFYTTPCVYVSVAKVCVCASFVAPFALMVLCAWSFLRVLPYNLFFGLIHAVRAVFISSLLFCALCGYIYVLGGLCE